jgi:hypothetical protein
MATLVNIQKKLHERASQIGAAAKAAEMNGMALKKITEKMNWRQEMMRAALGPLADIQNIPGLQYREYDTGKPDGTPQKLLDVSKLNNLGYRAAHH